MSGATEASVQVTLLGGLRLASPAGRLDGRLLGHRSELLLARLAVDLGQVVPRESLAEALWGQARPNAWRGSLRNAVVDARRVLAEAAAVGEIALRTSVDGYLLDLPPGSSVDLLVLRADTERARRVLHTADFAGVQELTEQALAASAAPLLPGAPGDWVEGLRQEVEHHRCDLALFAGEAALALADAGRAEQFALRVIEAAPLREDGRRLLIRALWGRHRRAEALAAYDAWRRELSAVLGAQPAPATQALFMDILAEERSEQPVRSEGEHRPLRSGPLLRMAEGTPFVGRAELLGWLTARARLVRDAGPLVVCLSGEAGLGKTRLAAELAARSSESGRSVLYGRAEDRLALPYAALVEALERAIGESHRRDVEARLSDHLDVLATLMPSLRSGAGAVEPVERFHPVQIRKALLEALEQVCGDRGAILVLDDMQWASQAELALVEQVVLAADAPALLVLVMHRDPADPAALPRLGSHPRVARRELDPLNSDEVRLLGELVAPHAGGDAREQARRVWRSSGGNALIAAALLRTGERSDLTRRSVGSLVRERMSGLAPGTEEVMRLAAVAGLDFDPHLVRAVSGAGSQRAGELLDAARSAELIVASTSRPDRLTFRHGLVRDALLEDLTDAETAALHQRLGLRLEVDAAADRSGLVELAYHFAGAAPTGDWHRALRYALPVAREAARAGVWEDVIVLASRALGAFAAAGDPPPRERLELLVLLGRAQRALGDPHGLETLATAFDAAVEQRDGARMADAALAVAVAGAMSESSHLDVDQLPRYEWALTELDPRDDRRRAELLSRIASAHTWNRGATSSRPFAAEAETLARRLGDDRVLATTLLTLRHSLVCSSEVERMGRMDDELNELTARLADPVMQVTAAQFRFDNDVQRGVGTDLEATVHEAATQVQALRIATQHHSVAFRQAALALLRGRVAEAELLVERAASLGRDGGVNPVIVEVIRVVQLLHVRSEQGRVAGLRDEAAALTASAGRAVWPGTLAIVDAACGRFETVAPRIDAILDGYERDGQTVLCPGGAIATLAETVILLEEPGRARRVRDLIAPLAGQGAYIGCFTGPVDYHLGRLHRFLADRAAADRAFAAAAAFSRRLGAPRWVARCDAALDA